MRLPRRFLFVALLLAAPLALAQQAPLQQRMSAEEFKAAGLDKLNAEELARLDAWLAGHAPAARANPSVASGTTAGQTPPRRAPLPFLRQGEGPVHSRAKGTISAWTIGTVFELENGQKWQVVAGESKLYRPLVNPEVTVVPGLRGRWFMQMDADPDVAKPKVERIE